MITFFHYIPLWHRAVFRKIGTTAHRRTPSNVDSIPRRESHPQRLTRKAGKQDKAGNH